MLTRWIIFDGIGERNRPEGAGGRASSPSDPRSAAPVATGPQRRAGTPVLRDGRGRPGGRASSRSPIVVGLAAAGNAACIVTGDTDLLVLGRYGGSAILTPRRFPDLIRREGAGADEQGEPK